MVMLSEGNSETYMDSINDYYQEMAVQGLYSENMNIKLAVSLYSKKHANDKSIFNKLQVMGEVGIYQLDLEKFLSSEKIDILLSHYTEVIDSCLFYKNADASSNGLVQPKELVQFCSTLIDLKENSEVYYPFAGMGSFAVENPSCSFTGEEISPYTWSLMQIYLDAHNISSNITIGDSFLNLREMDMTCDNIIMAPPFGLRSGTSNEYDALSYALKGLNGDGKLIAILPMSFCYSNQTSCFNLRKYLIENHYLSTIVALPHIYYPYTDVSVCVVLIEKTATDEPQDSFLLVDGRSYVKKSKNGKEFILDTEGLLKAIHNDSDDNCIVKLTSHDVSGYYNLAPSRYLLDTSKIENGAKLKELVDIYVPHYYDGDMWVVSNFSDDWNKCSLTLKRSDNVIKRRAITNDGNCMMIQYSNERLMIGVIDELPHREKVAVGSLTIAFHIKDTKRIQKKYLLYALKSKVVTAQAQAMATGETIPRLSSGDFLELVISCPSLSEQEKIMHEAEDKYLQQLGVSRTSSDIAHMLGTPSVHIGNALKLLELSQNLDKNDREALTYLKDNFEYMDRLLKLNSILDFSQLDRKPLCLADFIKGYISKWKSFGSNTFRISFDGDDNALKAKVSANRDALMIMFDCLFDNANRHGFHKEKNHNNELTILLLSELKEGAPLLIMRVGNNGTPLDKNFTINDYITRGRFKADSGRSGLGGYHVNAVVQSMGGELSSIIRANDWTAFEFSIPIVNIVELNKSRFLQQ